MTSTVVSIELAHTRFEITRGGEETHRGEGTEGQKKTGLRRVRHNETKKTVPLFHVIENFYSDSLSDTPLALCAEKAHLVSEKATKVSDWPALNPETIKEVRKKIDTGWDHLD